MKGRVSPLHCRPGSKLGVFRPHACIRITPSGAREQTGRVGRGSRSDDRQGSRCECGRDSGRGGRRRGRSLGIESPIGRRDPSVRTRRGREGGPEGRAGSNGQGVAVIMAAAPFSLVHRHICSHSQGAKNSKVPSASCQGREGGGASAAQAFQASTRRVASNDVTSRAWRVCGSGVRIPRAPHCPWPCDH